MDIQDVLSSNSKTFNTSIWFSMNFQIPENWEKIEHFQGPAVTSRVLNENNASIKLLAVAFSKGAYCRATKLN